MKKSSFGHRTPSSRYEKHGFYDKHEGCDEEKNKFKSTHLYVQKTL